MAEKSKILIIGGTGYIGRFIVEASAKAGHPTFVLIRQSAVSDPILNQGDLNDHGSLLKAIKQVDVVTSTVGALQVADQTKIIAAIKEAGNIKKFYPSEFGSEIDRVRAVEPEKSLLALKAQIRRAIQAEEIPHTYLVSNGVAGVFLPTLAQPGVLAAPPPPRDQVIILGDGNVKVSFLSASGLRGTSIP